MLFSKSVRVDAEEQDCSGANPSPSTILPDQGLLEQVTEAVRPLTDGDSFQLKSLSYCDSYQDGGTIRLVAPQISIDFIYNLRAMNKISLLFRVRSLNEPLVAEPLFAARHIPITFHHWELPHDSSDHVKIAAYNSEDIIAFLLWETGFIEELNRLCSEIHANLPALCDALIPENLDETLRLYALENRKNTSTKSRSLSVSGQRRSECPGIGGGETGSREGKIERILEALKPIDKLYRHKTIYYDVIHDRFDVDALQSDNAGCDIYLRSGANGGFRLYFVGYLLKESTVWRRGSMNKTEPFFFSAENVFELLDIDYTSIKEWHMKNLQMLCELIDENSTAVFRAFSMENKAKTFTALMAMKGNDNEILRSIRDLARGLAE